MYASGSFSLIKFILKSSLEFAEKTEAEQLLNIILISLLVQVLHYFQSNKNNIFLKKIRSIDCSVLRGLFGFCQFMYSDYVIHSLTLQWFSRNLSLQALISFLISPWIKQNQLIFNILFGANILMRFEM